MKKTLILSLLASPIWTQQLQAASAAFVRSLTRNTSAASGDAALYNPASSAVQKGCNFYVSNLSLRREWDIRSQDANYDTTVKAMVVPEFHSSCGGNGLGFFASIYPSGGSANFDKGLPSYIKEMNTTLKTGIQNQSLGLDQPRAQATIVNNPQVAIDAQQLEGNLHLGAAYALNPQLALALGVKQVYATRTVKAKLHFDDVLHPSPVRDYSQFQIQYQQKAYGLAPLASLSFLGEDWQASLRYEASVPLQFRTDVDRDDTFDIAQAADLEPVVVDGERFRQDRPATLNAGLSRSWQGLAVHLDGNYTLQKGVKSEGWQKALNRKAVVYNNPSFGKADERDNAWSVAGSAELAVSSSLLLSGGMMYNNAGSNQSINVDEVHVLSSYVYGTGLQYRHNQALSLDVGYLLVDAIDSYNQDESEVYRYRDQVFSFGLNFQN